MRKLTVRRLFFSVAVAFIGLGVLNVDTASAGSMFNRRDRQQKKVIRKTPSTASSSAANSREESSPNLHRLGGRSAVVDNHQPLVDEQITADASVHNHMVFVDPNSLSEFVVDDISAEVAYLKGAIPTFESVCTALEGPDVDSEDALLRCLKRLYYPDHPIYTGRSGIGGIGGGDSALRISADSSSSDAFADGIGDTARKDGSSSTDSSSSPEGEGPSGAEALLSLKDLDVALMLDVDGWMPFQIANGSNYLCRMPREGDTELTEGPDGELIPKKKAPPKSDGPKKGKKAKKSSSPAAAGNKKRLSEAQRKAQYDLALLNADLDLDEEELALKQREARQKMLPRPSLTGGADGGVAEEESLDAADEEGGNAEDEDDEEEEATTFEQLKPGQKLPPALRVDLSRRMRGQCSTKSAGWWTYEVCWEEHVKQFHAEQGTVTTSHYLGQGPKKKIEDGAQIGDVYYNVHSVRGPYLSATFLNGSTCDVTGEPRIAEIRLFCDPDGGRTTAAQLGLPEQASSAINLHAPNLEISEPETCAYLVWMGSPRACLKQIEKPQGPIVSIRCRNVDDL